MPSSYSLVNMPSGIFPVYFLEGDDDFLISECSAELKGSFPPEILSDFNYAKVAATKKFLSSEVEALAEELPIMAPFKTIEIADFQKAPSEEKDRLAAFVKSGLGKTILIFLVNASDKQGKTSSAQKRTLSSLKSAGAFIDCRINDRNWDAWIKKTAVKKNIDIEPSALSKLKIRLGSDYSAAVAELDKLKAYVAGRGKISSADVETVSSVSFSAQIYQIADEVTRGNSGGALRVLYKMNLGRSSLSVLSYLKRYFLQMAEIRESFKRTGSISQTAQALKKHEFVVRKTLDLSSGLTSSQFSRIFQIILETDLAFKSGHNERLSIETALIKLSLLFSD